MALESPSKNGKIRLLFLEDRPSDVRLAVRELQKAGLELECDVVDNSKDFIERMQRQSYHIILADYNVPDWTGIDAIRWVRSRDALVPIVLVTATLGDEQAVECIKEGATDYILKDHLQRLPAAVSRALDEARVRADHDLAVKELHDSEQRYRLLFQGNPNPMWVYDVETMRFLAVNDAAVQQYGYSREEFLSMTIRDIRPPEELEAFMKEYAAWDKHSDLELELYRHRKKSGAAFDVQLSSRHIDWNNREARLVLILDVTARLQALRALKDSETQFRSIVDGAPYGIYRVNQDGRLLTVNPALVKMLGYASEQEVLQLNTANDIYADRAERDRALLLHEQEDYVADFEAKWKRKDGKQIFVRLAGRKIESALESQLYEVFAQDITEQRLLEQQFQQAQKMEAVGRLAGGVAHDVNNMLMIIGSYAQLLEDAKGDPEKSKRYTNQIKEAINKTASITRQLLAFSRKQVLEPAVLDLNGVVADLAKMLPRLLGEDVHLVFAPDTRLGRISADRGQMEQVVMNLAVNARDAMPKGGRLLIETSNVELDAGYGANHGIKLEAGPYVMLAVTDEGIGMDAETRARIFEPFFTTKERGKGTGLGLATVYGIVKQSDGFIWVYSEPGRGTTFKIYMPRLSGEFKTATPARQLESVPQGTETLLLVEDEAALRAGTSEYLRSKGYKIVEAESGAKALELLRQHGGTVHVLLTDIVMPGLGGPELAEAALKMHPELKIIYMSGYTDRSISQEILGTHAIFLQKPFSLDVLARRIRTLLGK